MDLKKSKNSTPRIKIIQKLYNALMNPDSTIDYPKSQYKKFIKDVVTGTLERSILIEEKINSFLANDIDLLYLSIFRRNKWNENISIIDKDKLNDNRTYSTFENTCPHIIVFAKSFQKSQAFINPKPLSVNLSGEREWTNLYSFIEAIRIPEAVEVYFKFGLPRVKYFFCKNHSLKNFLPALIKIFLNGPKSGLNYIKTFPHIIKNMLFPNFYLSIFIYIIKKVFLK